MTSEVQRIYGPIYAGMLANVILYGMTMAQLYLYFNMFKHDKKWMKTLVWVLYAINTANATLGMVMAYDPTINKFGNVIVLERSISVWAAVPITTGIIALITHVFFAWRLKVLTESNVLLAVILFGAVASCGGAVATAVFNAHITEFAQFYKFKPVITVWLGAQAGVDAVITISLFGYLWKNRKILFGAETDLADKTICLTMQTGLVMTMWSITTLTLYLALAPPSTIYLIFNLPLPTVYVNTLMSSLNSRRGWKYDDSENKTLVGSKNVSVQSDPKSKPIVKFETTTTIGPLTTVGDVSVGDVKTIDYPSSTTTLPLADNEKSDVSETPSSRTDSHESV